MPQYTMLILAVLLVSIPIILPTLVYSFTKSHQTTLHPHHIPDAIFIPNYESFQLQTKRNKLSHQIDELVKKQGGSCTAWDLQQLKEQVANCHTSLELEVNLRTACQGKWNTICQSWRIEREEYYNRTVQLTVEKNKDSIKIQNLVNELELLKSQLPCQGCPTCPVCPGGKPCPQCEECHEERSCPACVECKPCAECAECPHCRDKDYELLKKDYASLYNRFDNLEKEIKLCRAEVVDCEDQLEGCRSRNNENITAEDCRHLTEEVSGRVVEGVRSLRALLHGGAFRADSVKNIQDLISKVEEHIASAKTAQEQINGVTVLVQGLVKELRHVSQANSGGYDYESLLKECLGKYKGAVGQLQLCESKLAPFIRK